MAPRSDRPRATYQGKCIVEEFEGEFMIMTPDGECTVAVTRKEAERRCKRWFKAHAFTGFDVGIIEWTQAR